MTNSLSPNLLLHFSLLAGLNYFSSCKTMSLIIRKKNIKNLGGMYKHNFRKYDIKKKLVKFSIKLSLYMYKYSFSEIKIKTYLEYST